MAGIYLAYEKEAVEYPDGTYFWSPDTAYPEYPWDSSTISPEKNRAYALVRECLRVSGYDSEHYGESSWNPLGVFVHPGNTVLIKPNWVDHHNKNEKVQDNLACLVTNPSIVRAVVDYVAIALDGKGKIILADAPMQGCNLEEMFSIVGYQTLFSFWKAAGIDVEIADMRKYKTQGITRGVMSLPMPVSGSHGFCLVEMAEKSLHSEKDAEHPAYKVTDYPQSLTASYHATGRHCYEVSRIPLEADVIINLPKPKTHRLAGITAAVKNFVGVTYEKASLPHRIEGDSEHGGDAYRKKSNWKEHMAFWDEKRTAHSRAGEYRRAKACDLAMKACYAAGALTTGDHYRIGSWYGNDTIWRTAVDLNYIMLYADREGILRDKPQRTVLTIGDMLVCGQKNGPVSPEPKPLGMVMMSESTLLFDRAICEIMGFDAGQLPIFNHARAAEMLGYPERSALMKEKLYKNFGGGQKEGMELALFHGLEEWRFEAHTCWKGHLEKWDEV